MSIRDLIQNKTASERATIKGQEIAKVPRRKYTRGDLQIEIVDIEPIERGVSVYAKAWRQGKQIGFGIDGSVEIERFNIYNPPILVEDPNGDIIKESYNSLTEEATVRKLKEDPQEALLQVIEHNLSVMKNIHDDKRIVVGKRGKTTSTFYPDAHTESTSVDGWISKGNSSVWSTTRDATSGALVDDGDDAIIQDNTGGEGPSTGKTSGGFFVVGRLFTLFDTSSIPDSDTISSATLSYYVSATANGDNDGDDWINIYTTSPASNTNLVLDDFDQIGSTAQSTQIDIGSITTSAYNNWALNATGISNISKTGITKFGAREGHDAIDSAYAGGNNTRNYITVYLAEQSGTTTDPKLVVEHASASRRVFVIS